MTPSSTVQLLQHPGPAAPTRRDVLGGDRQSTYRITLAHGATLYDSVQQAMAALHLTVAALSIRHASFSHLSYYLISPRDTEGGPVAHYTTSHELDEHAVLVGSGATIGTTDAGRIAIHCHGLVVTDSGRLVGGHLLTDHCTLAEDGVAYLSALGHMRLVIGVDPEIQTPVFQPSRREA